MEITVNPIPKYPAYYEKGGRLYGITEAIYGPRDMVKIEPTATVDGKEQSVKADDFCVIDGVPYWTVKIIEQVEESDSIEHVKSVKLVDGKVVAASYTVPQMTLATGSADPFWVEAVDGQSVAYQDGKPKEPLGYVENFFRCNEGLLISAPEGRGTARKPGLLMWRVGKSNMDHFAEVGRLWK